MGIQVYEATKDGQGNSLPILNRQFISFSYGGKKIEDFNLLAVFSNDRLNKEVYAPFEDTTTQQAELDGQLFWRSKFNPLTLTFTLATDGITSKQLEDFKEWFRPGIERELILSEYHNRAILARVSTTPSISLLPFEEKIQVKVANTLQETSISLYKGEIVLNFIADEPFWYAKNSIIRSLDRESLKIIYEDDIPYIGMFNLSGYSCFLANNQYYNSSEIENNLNITIDGVNDANQSNYYLYYCGSAAAKPEISFSITPVIDSDIGDISFPLSPSKDTYFLKVGEQDFTFSLPTLLTSYNYALKTVREFSGNSILDLRKILRDSLYNYYTRSWVMGIIDYARGDVSHAYVSATGEIKSTFKSYFINEMKKFIKSSTPINFTFNTQNGTAILKASVNSFVSNYITETKYINIIENTGNMIKSDYLIIEPKNSPKNGFITGEECYLVTTSTILENIKINYKYMYL